MALRYSCFYDYIQVVKYVTYFMLVMDAHISSYNYIIYLCKLLVED